MTRRMLAAVILLVATSASTGANADPPSSCTDRSHPTFAKLLRPSGGVAQVTTGPTGTLFVQSGGPAPAVMVSTTGSITVEIEQACLLSLTLTVTKTGQPAPVHTETWGFKCTHTTFTDEVPIGLDGGEYRFQLTGETCGGGKVREDGQGGFVADPPIL